MFCKTMPSRIKTFERRFLVCYLEDPLGVCQESTCISSRMTSALPKCRRTVRRPEPKKQPSSSHRARGSEWTAPGTLPRFTFFITEVPTRQTKLPLVGIFSFFSSLVLFILLACLPGRVHVAEFLFCFSHATPYVNPVSKPVSVSGI